MKLFKSTSMTILVIAVILLLTWVSTADAATRVVNFYIPDENAMKQKHRTHLFRSTSWYIVRRSNELSFRVQLDAALDENQSMSFQIAPYSIVDVRSIRMNHLGGGNYDVFARIPANAPVGIHSIGLKLSTSTLVRQLPKQVAVLFNAWSPDTVEYFPRPDELSEYIEQEHSITYRGSTAQVQDVRWYLGQFTHECLSVSLYFVNRLNETERRDPGLVVRHLTAMSAHQETVADGLLFGKWEGGFAGGTNPSSWSDSVQIFRQYISQGFRTVRFGQCWVFGAVLNSMTRSLGLASAQVSVFDSTHEYAAERTGIYMQRIGRYFEQNYRYMVAETGKIWNFHSFNVVYFMNRHADWPYNLPDWNVIDSTPQEFSLTGDYRLGPAPLKAVREGKKLVNYDTSFVIAEVSARHHSFLVSCQYMMGGGGQRLPPGCKVTKDLGASPTVASGTFIVAKAVNGFVQQPWTHMFHTRARSPAEDPSILRRFPAVRAFDILRNDDPSGMSSLVFDPTFNSSPVSTFEAQPNAISPLSFTPRTTSAFRTFTRGLPTNIIDESMESFIHPLPEEESSSDLIHRLHTEDEVDLNHATAANKYEEVILYQYDNTGIAMSVIIPPVQLGKPLEVYLNFACEAQTAQFKNQLSRKDLSTKVITLNMNASTDKMDFVTDDDDHISPAPTASASALANDVTECATTAAVSFHLDLHLTDYTTRSLGKIADINGKIILKQHNGYFESYRIVVTDYMEKALKFSSSASETVPEYVRAVVMATDHTTDEEKDIIMIAERKSCIAMPKIALNPSTTKLIIPRTTPSNPIATDTVIHTASASSTVTTTASPQPTLVQNHPVQVSISYHNQLMTDLTDVAISISADNLGFDDHVVHIGVLKAGMKLQHVHTFNAFYALDGLHFYHVVITSTQIAPSREVLEFTINN